MCSHSHSTKYVYDTVVWAKGQLSSENDVPIKFYGDKKYNGKSY